MALTKGAKLVSQHKGPLETEVTQNVSSEDPAIRPQPPRDRQRHQPSVGLRSDMFGLVGPNRLTRQSNHNKFNEEGKRCYFARLWSLQA